MKNKRQYVCKLLVYSVSYVGSTYFTSVPPSFPEVPSAATDHVSGEGLVQMSEVTGCLFSGSTHSRGRTDMYK